MRYDHEFHLEMDRLQAHLPDWAGRHLYRLRQPHAMWVRVPAGFALIGGGMLGFLPVLGFWMLPLGLALLAIDVPFMHRPMARALAFTCNVIEKAKNRFAARRGGANPAARDADPAQ